MINSVLQVLSLSLFWFTNKHSHLNVSISEGSSERNLDFFFFLSSVCLCRYLWLYWEITDLLWPSQTVFCLVFVHGFPTSTSF